MPKMLILMMENVYPFGQKTQKPTQNQTSIKVRQTKNVHLSNRQNILSKATFVKNLKNRYLIKVESILEESDCIHILYEHVQYNFNDFDFHNQQYKYNILEQLHELGNYLSNIGIKVDLNKNKIGINQQGNLKYFLGLDFQWEDNPDQNYLRCYYRNNMNRLIEGDINLDMYNNMIVGKTSRDYIEKLQHQNKEKQRKSSFATLPSRFNRWKKIDQKLSNIKASVRNHTHQENIRSHSNNDVMTKVISKEHKRQQSPLRLPKRSQDRKYSAGDIKFTAIAKKPYQKQNDIKSQIGHKNDQTAVKSVLHVEPSEIATKRSRSRIQEMKYRQYQQLTNSNKNYLKDFMSVLEDQPGEQPGSMNYVSTTPSKTLYNSTKQFSPEKKERSNQKDQTSIMGETKAMELKTRAKEAVINSMKVIQKFRQLQLKK